MPRTRFGDFVPATRREDFAKAQPACSPESNACPKALALNPSPPPHTTHRRRASRDRMLNEALLPKGPAREDPPEPTLGKAATAAAAKATALEDGKPEPDRADMNRDILLAAAGLLPDGVDSVVVAAAAQVGVGPVRLGLAGAGVGF